MRQVEMPTAEDVGAARERIRGLVADTPLVESAAFGAALKLESFQPTGSFKVRGAAAALTALPPGTRVVAASAGNHGLGVAWAAERLGVEATLVVAETASPAKVEALRRFPARLVLHGGDYDAAEAHALELAAAEEARFVSPYNDRDVIAGQGTLGLDLLDAGGGEATLVVPVGGGGLAAGIGLVAAPAGARIVGVVPEASPALRAALAAGRAVPVRVRETLADGLAGNIEPGSVTVPLCSRLLDDLVAVSEEELAEAMRLLAREHGLVAEGSGAAAAAALLAGKVERDRRAVAIVSGRNVAPATLARVLAE
ncbi:MAG TPA: pyridoxal-phosphate dependent enzyme [Gaiellaceae bacterium]|nr:pyridoxal-phosphate dependent enzyme [Gaiellaceae bacterium]